MGELGGGLLQAGAVDALGEGVTDAERVAEGVVRLLDEREGVGAREGLDALRRNGRVPR